MNNEVPVMWLMVDTLLPTIRKAQGMQSFTYKGSGIEYGDGHRMVTHPDREGVLLGPMQHWLYMTDETHLENVW